MISVVVCSKNEELKKSLLANIRRTVGCPYETVIIDNYQKEFSIFEAYNMGIKRSKGTLLCFVHEDVVFHTSNWGKIIENIFEADKSLGLLGIAGSRMKLKMPSGWWDAPQKYHVLNIIQHSADQKVQRKEKGFGGKSEIEVAVIDGVFMVMNKASGVQFNKNLSGFHNYDLNISLENINRGKKVMVTNKILIEHFSTGVMNPSWYLSTIKVHKLYSDYLPVNTEYLLNKEEYLEVEFNHGTKFLHRLLYSGFKKEIIPIWFRLFLLKPKSEFHCNFAKKFLRNL